MTVTLKIEQNWDHVRLINIKNFWSSLHTEGNEDENGVVCIKGSWKVGRSQLMVANGQTDRQEQVVSTENSGQVQGQPALSEADDEHTVQMDAPETEQQDTTGETVSMGGVGVQCFDMGRGPEAKSTPLDFIPVTFK